MWLLFVPQKPYKVIHRMEHIQKMKYAKDVKDVIFVSCTISPLTVDSALIWDYNNIVLMTHESVNIQSSSLSSLHYGRRAETPSV